MTDQERLEELLNRWEDLRDRGQLVPDEELCRDCPHLLDEFRRQVNDLKRIDGFLSGGLNQPDKGDEEELTTAGRYRPIRLHAQGGLGEVFVARDEELGRKVALKRIRSLEAVNPRQVRRFQVEAEITGSLDHPGIVPVYGLGRDAKGRLYYAMRFIGGSDLQQAIDEFHRTYPSGTDSGAKAKALKDLIRTFLAACQTIAYVHSQDVIHRDIKPANIMPGPYGETLVIDWGLAKRLPKRVDAGSETLDLVEAPVTTVTDKTQLGQIKGSPAFMSPEQASGLIDQIGPRSDIYGLGATFYTILAGKPPFARMPLVELLDHVKRGEFPRPRLVRDDIPPALEAICLKAMSVKPEDRYASALDLAEDLKHWLDGDPVSAWREPWTLRAVRWVRKHQTLASTMATAVLVALLGVSAVAVQQQHLNRALVVVNKKERDGRLLAEAAEKRAREAEQRERAAAALAKRETENARVSEQKARRESYDYLVLSAERALNNGDRGFAANCLEQCPEDLRNVEWRLLYHRALVSRQTWRIDRGSIPSVAGSADGARIAVADLNGPVRLLDAMDGRPLAELGGPARKVAFLPDGDHLLVHLASPYGTAPDTVKLWSIEEAGGDDLLVHVASSHSATAPGPVELWSVPEKKRVASLTLSSGVDQFVLSGDGQRVALVSVLWPSPLGETKEVTSRICVGDPRSGRPIALADGIRGCVADAAFSPDHGRLFAVVRQINVRPELGFAARFLYGDSRSTRFQLLAWKVPDARELKFGPWKPLHPTPYWKDVAGYLRDLNSRFMKPLFRKDGPKDADAVAMAISPDGRQILVSDKNRPTVGADASRPAMGRIIVFDAATGETVKADAYDLNLPAPGLAARPKRPFDRDATLGSLAVSPDGKRLAVVSGTGILVFDRASGKRLADLAGHLAAPQCVVFDGNDLLTAGGADGQVKRWAGGLPSTDRIVLPAGQAWGGRGVAFSSDSRRMASATADGGIEILAVATGRLGMTVPPMASAVGEDELRETNRLDPLAGTIKEKIFHGYRAGDIRFSSDGKRLTATYYDRLICVWDISGEKPALVEFIDLLALERGRKLAESTQRLLSPDGRYLATASNGAHDKHYNRVWEIENRRLVVSHEEDVSAGKDSKLAFTADGRTFFLRRGSSSAGSLRAWDLESGKPTKMPGDGQWADAADQANPDGSRVLRIVDGVIKIEDRAHDRTLIEYPDQAPYHWATFSPDGNYILACGLVSAELLDASPIGKPLGRR